VTTLDNRLAATMEPRAASPQRRLETIRRLADAGIETSVMVAPVIPGLTDHEIPALLKAAADAGATGAGWVMLRLPHQNRALFMDWLKRHVPERAEAVENKIREMRGGDLYESTHSVRHRGRGPLAEQIEQMFRLFAGRYGLAGDRPSLSSAAFRRPEVAGQGELFRESAGNVTGE
ncbi:MAG: hypothetical protein R3336_10295, partial [Phycisphaeraceae bacterium]|nr:hypothetical protein [Phycisphaeraceae bacterium]